MCALAYTKKVTSRGWLDCDKIVIVKLLCSAWLPSWWTFGVHRW